MQALDLFEGLVVDAPKTEGIKYAGSKLKLPPHIFQLVQKVNPETVLDGFAGTTRVSQALAQAGHRVIANDVSAWSKVFGTCYLLNHHPEAHCQPLIDHLNDKPEMFGKARRRTDASDTVSNSVFEDFRRNEAGRFVAVEAIERLLRTTRAKHVILSYGSGGRATAEELNGVISSVGRLVETIEVDCRKNVMAGMRWTNEWVNDAEMPNREFLFLIEK